MKYNNNDNKNDNDDNNNNNNNNTDYNFISIELAETNDMIIQLCSCEAALKVVTLQ